MDRNKKRIFSFSEACAPPAELPPRQAVQGRGGARGATGKPVLERSRSRRCSLLGPDNSLLRGAVLASWAATREMPAAPSALCYDKMSPTMVKCRLEVKNCS